jgi:hypothetical protein
MLLSSNKVTLNDAPLYGEPVEKEYIETRVDYSIVSEIPDGEGTTNAYIGVYINMDDSHKATVRQVQTFTMAVADTGGFMTIVFLVTVIIVERL